jgi:DNA-binding CsgD family transcriptional regulator
VSNPTDDSDLRLRRTFAALLFLIACWHALDMALDDAPWLSFHVFVEVGSVALLFGAVVYLWSGWMSDRRGLRRAEQRIVATRQDAAEWRARAEKLLAGLGTEIDRQFDGWSLTPAEREVALLVLKGLGHKEAASLLGRSERTVRQHAASVYRKSGLAGRAELAAFFLEDLLLPAPTADPERSRAQA